MNSWQKNRQLPAGNPLANALVILVGALVIGVSVLLGFVAFVALGSIIAVLAAVIGIRLWWYRRKLEKAGRHKTSGSQATGSIDVIEGEYRDLSEDSRDQSPRNRQD